MELLKEHLDNDDFPLLRQCEHYRSLASKKDRTKAAAQGLTQTADAIEASASIVLPRVADQPLVETQTTPLERQSTLASRRAEVQLPWHPLACPD